MFSLPPPYVPGPAYRCDVIWQDYWNVLLLPFHYQQQKRLSRISLSVLLLTVLLRKAKARSTPSLRGCSLRFRLRYLPYWILWKPFLIALLETNTLPHCHSTSSYFSWSVNTTVTPFILNLAGVHSCPLISLFGLVRNEGLILYDVTTIFSFSSHVSWHWMFWRDITPFLRHWRDCLPSDLL